MQVNRKKKRLVAPAALPLDIPQDDELVELGSDSDPLEPSDLVGMACAALSELKDAKGGIMKRSLAQRERGDGCLKKFMNEQQTDKQAAGAACQGSVGSKERRQGKHVPSCLHRRSETCGAFRSCFMYSLHHACHCE